MVGSRSRRRDCLEQGPSNLSLGTRKLRRGIEGTTVTKHFTKGVFDFLKELEANNNKPWWEENKDRYIRVIREPALDFIEDFGERIHQISPHYVADTRTNGGSLMRPYRDMRFSKDKTPYKTNVGIHFRHEGGKDVHAPGFYLHIEASGSFGGVGLWNPVAKVAGQIRQAINDDPAGWRKSTKGKSFTDIWSLDHGDESTLKRVPKDFDEDHPYPDDLRLKSFTAGTKLSQKVVTSNEFDAHLAREFKRASNYMAFLSRAIGVTY